MRHWTVFVATLVAALPVLGAAQTLPPLLPILPAMTIPSSEMEPYCGLLAIHAAARLEGVESQFEKLLDPRFIGSFDGSSAEELVAAAKQLGLDARVFSQLDDDALAAIDKLAILHVKPQLDAEEFSHWVLYIGTRDGRAMLIDGDQRVSEPLGQLAARWDGIAVVVSRSSLSADRPPMIPGGAGGMAAVIAGSSLVVLGNCRQIVKRSHLSAVKTVAGAAALLTVGTALGGVYHHFSNQGFYHQSDALNGVLRANAGTFLAPIEFSALRSMIRNGHTLVLDARIPEDYARGHINGALNVTVRASDARIRKIIAIAAGKTDATIVVYCQSPSCPYARTVASRLVAAGVSNVRLYKGGWLDWAKQQGEIETGPDATLHPG